MESIKEVENFISAVKLRTRPHVNTYEHDGNVTSSSADSSDSGTTGTKGVDNSFDSDEPSTEEN
ncbi:hypothetical protein TcasGA2_TC034121 [Tribolium castaneum]|uniref:Uncharacterized protein n=1 Tax=Tribolium castaneum TaxID=7070 RepID=A0A139WDG3_TRICA|nr:hypothetical protein TcasGA2_TC034121 [Tribolium castaneum]